MNTILKNILVEKSTEFDKWFKKLNDYRAKVKILFRLQQRENEEHFGVVNQLETELSN